MVRKGSLMRSVMSPVRLLGYNQSATRRERDGRPLGTMPSVPVIWTPRPSIVFTCAKDLIHRVESYFAPLTWVRSVPVTPRKRRDWRR
jgi:hypothetical protein